MGLENEDAGLGVEPEVAWGQPPEECPGAKTTGEAQPRPGSENSSQQSACTALPSAMPWTSPIRFSLNWECGQLRFVKPPGTEGLLRQRELNLKCCSTRLLGPLLSPAHRSRHFLSRLPRV